MYLSILKENEKENFLGLAYTLASADGSVSAEEKEMISQYCYEMGISETNPAFKNKSDLIAEICKSSDDRSKKIIVFELIGLAMADNRYDDSEKNFILNAIEKFGLPINYATDCESVIVDYLALQERINTLVLN